MRLKSIAATEPRLDRNARRRRQWAQIWLITLIFLIDGQNVLAQQNGTLKGQILDLTETGIPWAKVTVEKDGQKYEIDPDKDGKVELALPAGAYLLLVRADGFLPSEERQIKILAGQTTETRVTMLIECETIGCPAPDLDRKATQRKKEIQPAKTTKEKARKRQSKTSA
jgi:hypothetical protein